MHTARFTSARPLLYLFFALLGLAGSAAPARAALFSDDDARKAILELRDTVAKSDREQRERLDALTKRIDELANRIDAVQHGQLEAADRNDAANQEMARLRGVTEELRNDLNNTQKRERDRYADLDTRLHKLEPADVSFDGKSATVSHDEQAAYDVAVAQFRSSDFRSAIHALDAFVARYPQSVYSASAQFWLGSSYYAVKDFPAAIAAQQYLLEHFPDSPRVPEALLNLAASQAELNDKKSARATLQRITKDYPNTEQARLAEERLSTLQVAGAKDKKK
jgi:tol-pal system protein YbgF